MHHELLSPQIEATIWDSEANVATEKDFGKDHPVVYYLTDASGNKASFDTSVRFLQKLIEITGIRLVCLEGGSGPVPRLEKWKHSRHLLESHESYEVALSEALRDPPEFYGVDDPGRYRFAVRAMKSLTPARKSWAALFSRVSLELNRSGRRKLSPRFGNLLAVLKRYKSNFQNEILHLRTFALQAGIPIHQYKEIGAILSVIAAERQIDFRLANVEFKNLVWRINRLLLSHPLVHILDSVDSALAFGRSAQQAGLEETASPELAAIRFWSTAVGRAVQHELAAENAPARTGENLIAAFSRVFTELYSSHDLRDVMTKNVSPRYRRYLMHMYRSASLFGIPMEEYDNLHRYFQYMNRFHETMPERILQELDHLRRAVINSAILTDLDWLFNEVDQDLEIAKRLFTLAATSADVNQFHVSGGIHHTRLCQNLKPFIEGSESLRALQIVSAEFEQCLSDALNFYAEMPLRSKQMAINTISTMLRNQQTKAVLITGGFHAEEVSDNFTSRKVSHLVLRPKVERSTSSAELESYFGRITTGPSARIV